MAIADNGMFGPSKGKVGNLVYYTRKGKPIVRKVGRTDKPRTELQLANQLRMAVTNVFCKTVKPFTDYGFAERVAGKDLNQMNVAVSYIKKNAIRGEYPDFSIDYPKVLLSEGPLLQADGVQVEIVDEGLKFGWYVDPELRWPDATDQVMLLAYFPAEPKAVYQLFGAARKAGTAVLDISAPMLGDYMETYIAFISADRKHVSTSVYAGAFNVPADPEAAQDNQSAD